MFMEQVTGLYLVQWDDSILEENNMFFSQWHCKTWDDACKDIKQLWCSVELVGFVNQTVQAVIHGLSDHFSSRHQFSVESVEDIFQILSLSGFFWIEKLKELLDEWRSDVDFENSHLDGLVDDQLKEEFIDWL